MSIIKPNPTNFKGETELDVRVSPKLGRELADEINESIAHTQLFIQTTLPDRLIVTQKQFASLQPYTERMYETTDRMYVTPQNVMEVVIDRDIDIVAEVEGAITDAEQLAQARQEQPDNPSDDKPQIIVQ